MISCQALFSSLLQRYVYLMRSISVNESTLYTLAASHFSSFSPCFPDLKSCAMDWCIPNCPIPQVVSSDEEGGLFIVQIHFGGLFEGGERQIRPNLQHPGLDYFGLIPAEQLSLCFSRGYVRLVSSIGSWSRSRR